MVYDTFGDEYEDAMRYLTRSILFEKERLHLKEELREAHKEIAELRDGAFKDLLKKVLNR